MLDLLLMYVAVIVVGLCGDLLRERSRCATMCETVRALRSGGMALDIRAGRHMVIVCVPQPGLHDSQTLDNRDAA
jgi:hypothetical protein